MSAYRQIRLVLWKNFTIRRRRWPRAIFELIWPLFLFLILMWIRARNLVFYYDACHNDVKYLGSTGFLPALQTYICRWNNTCHNYTNPNGAIVANITINDFNQSIPITIMTILFSNPVNVSNLHQPWFINRTNSLSNINVAAEIFFASLQTNYAYSYQSDTNIKQSFCIDGQFNQTFLIHEIQSIEANDFLCNNLSTIDLKNFLITVQQQLDKQFLINLESYIQSTLLNVVQMIQIIQSIASQLDLFNNGFSLTEINASLSLALLCGGRNDLTLFFPSTSSGNNSSLNNSTTKDSRSEEASSKADATINIDWNNLALKLLNYKASDICQQSYQVGSGNAKNNVSVNRACRCVLFNEVFNANEQLELLNHVIRPLLYGKIYYYPSNIYYDNLIKQINQTFESLDELVKLFRQIQSTIQITYQNFLIICNLASNSFSICQQLNFDTTPLSLFTILTEFIACADRNRFVPMTSESNMIEEGQSNALTDRFLAGIVFLNKISNNDGLPKHIQYKIRMTLDKVDTTMQTRDDYFAYSPRHSVPLKTKYHTYTFIYLQNALDRAIIHAQTGLNLSYGVQTQQMPYPCWMDDTFAKILRQMLPLFMVLSWIFTVSMTVKDIVYEKEKRLKEIMRIMGLYDSVHWFTWFILCALIMVIPATLLAIILKVNRSISFFGNN
ncbi:unnamed protein product [Rotaria sp. Silwood2]|nr:unnamed protein product [Rotaria sp. Silwood2]